MAHPLPTASPHQSDDESNDDSMGGVGFGVVGGHTMVIEGLLGLAGGNNIEDDDLTF